MPETVVISHPLSHLLSPVAHTWNDTLLGNWGTAIDRICGDKIADPNLARHELDQIGAQFAVPPASFEPLTIDIERRSVTFRASREVTTSALDLFTRLACGQWNEARFHCLLRRPESHLPQMDLTVFRAQVSRPYDETEPWGQRSFPPHPHASIGIAESTLAARVAYHAYKALGAGAPGHPTFSLPEGPLSVWIDDRPGSISIRGTERIPTGRGWVSW